MVSLSLYGKLLLALLVGYSLTLVAREVVQLVFRHGEHRLVARIELAGRMLRYRHSLLLGFAFRWHTLEPPAPIFRENLSRDQSASIAIRLKVHAIATVVWTLGRVLVTHAGLAELRHAALMGDTAKTNAAATKASSSLHFSSISV